MAVGTFIQPDHEIQGGSEYKDALDNAIQVLARVGGLFAPHEQASPDMTVRLDAGALSGSTGPLEVGAQSTTTITAPSSQPRIDRVVIDASTGVISVVPGTEAASPAAPDIPAGKLPVCQVALATTTTVITNDLLTDERLLGGGAASANPDILVGDLYFTTNNYADSGAVAAAKGYGTWVRWGAGRFPVCFNSADGDFNAGEKTGGSKTKNYEHAHSVPSHDHSSYDHAESEAGFAATGGWTPSSLGGLGWDDNDHTSAKSLNTNLSGSIYSDVLNPYIVLFAWKRTA